MPLVFFSWQVEEESSTFCQSKLEKAPLMLNSFQKYKKM